MAGGWPGRRKDRSSTRSQQLRRAVLIRDSHRCRWVLSSGARCLVPANEADHIDPHGPDEMVNMQALCRDHHAVKTAAEGNAARWRYRRARDPEPHPGLTSP